MDESLPENTAPQNLPRSRLQEALLHVQAESVPPVALGLGILYAAFAVSHLIVLSPEIAPRMALVSGLSAAFYLVVYGRFRRRTLREDWVYPLSMTLYAVAVLNSELHLFLSRDPLQSTNVALCIVGAGIFLLSRRWLAAALVVTLVSWAWIVVDVAPFVQVVHFAFMTLGALAVAVLAFMIRRRNLMRVETLRLEADEHTTELERAMAVARRTEKTLHETETRYRNLVEQLPAATFIDALDAHATTLYISPQVEALTGYSVQEWMSDPELWEKIVHPEDCARVLEMTRQHNETGAMFDLEYRLVARDGRIVWVNDKAVVVRDARGKGLYSQGYLADITPRKLAEESVHRREAILEAVSFAAAVFLRAPHWEQHIDAVLERLGRAAQTDRVYVFENHHNGDGALLGSERFEWAAGGIAPQIHNPAFQNVAIDESGYRRWAELLSEGIPVHGDTHDFPESERVLLEQRQTLSIALMPIFVGAEWWGTIGLDSSVQEHDWSQAELDALQIAANVFGAAIQRERAERALARARDQALEASRLKSEFLAMMSHEIRTPMNSVVGMSEFLLETGLNAEQREYAKLVRHAADSLLLILNDILDFSKIEAGKLTLALTEFHLPSLVLLTKEIVAPQAREKGLIVRAELSSELPENLIGDAGRIRQTLLNLLSNAVKFTLQGEIVLSVGPDAVATQKDCAPGETVFVRFAVRDTGIGLSEQARERLFQPFTQADMSITRRFGGTGLGLAISKRLVELMGGEIGIESKEGAGSTFWFTLPLQVGPEIAWMLDAPEEEPCAAGDGGETDRLPIFQNKHVLLVEDNESNQNLALLQLRKLGVVNVTSAMNGAEAVALLSGAVRTGMPYDIVLMDCQMPELDGFEATWRIRAMDREEERRVPIVAMTASATPGDREACLAAGMDDFLAKPVQINALRRVLERWHVLPATLRGASDPQSSRVPFGTLDSNALKNLRALETPDTPGAINRLLESFMEEAGAQFSAMDEGLLSGDYDRVRRAAHSIKGSAAALGALELAARAARIESLAAERTAAGLEELLPDFRDELERAKAALKMELQRNPS